MDSYFRGRCDRLVLAAMSGAVTITADEAANTAQQIRNEVSDYYQHGALTDFARGMYQGQLTMVLVYMRPEKWIMQGIENEVAFYCRRAQQAELRSK